MGRLDILTGTLGKALGGASGGYVSARQEIVDLLRQRSRPYLFSNTVAPAIVGASLKVLGLVTQTKDLRDRLFSNTRFFREKVSAIGFDIRPGEHPIVPVMLGDAALATKMAGRLFEKGVYVVWPFPIPLYQKARLVSACSYRRRTAALTWNLRSRNSQQSSVSFRSRRTLLLTVELLAG